MKDRIGKKDSMHDIQDMRKPTRQGRSKKQMTLKETMADLFSIVPVVQKEKNPIIEKEQIPKGSDAISSIKFHSVTSDSVCSELIVTYLKSILNSKKIK